MLEQEKNNNINMDALKAFYSNISNFLSILNDDKLFNEEIKVKACFSYPLRNISNKKDYINYFYNYFNSRNFTYNWNNLLDMYIFIYNTYNKYILGNDIEIDEKTKYYLNYKLNEYGINYDFDIEESQYYFRNIYPMNQNKDYYDNVNILINTDRRNEINIYSKYGEGQVYNKELNRLKDIYGVDLSNKIVWVSRDLSDNFGYDILSYDENNNRPKLIEVKTSIDKEHIEFIISDNEYNKLKNSNNDYTYEIHKVLVNEKNECLFYKINLDEKDNVYVNDEKVNALSLHLLKEVNGQINNEGDYDRYKIKVLDNVKVKTSK